MRKSSKIILSCLAGNLLEWFDFTIYAYVIPVIAHQLMPPSSMTQAMILSYSLFAMGFLVRPLGAIAFGYIGDRMGRKTALVLSSLMMSVSTVAIGLLPSYNSIGILAPILLIICRLFQSLAVGGEFAGTLVYLLEQAPANKKGFYSSWTDVGCTLGVLLGSTTIVALTRFLSPEAFENVGWRIPFLSGIFLGFLSVYIRVNLSEPETFIHTKKESLPFFYLFKRMPKAFVLATLLIALNTLGFYILTIYIPNQSVVIGKFSMSDSFTINNYILLIFMCGGFISAFMCDYWDYIKIYFIGALGCLLLSYPMFYSFNLSIVYQLICMGLFAFSLGFCFGPRPLFFMAIFPPQVRFTGIAICLALGNGIFGGTAPLMATYLSDITGNNEIVAGLIMLSSIITLFAMHQLNKVLVKGYQSIPVRSL